MEDKTGKTLRTIGIVLMGATAAMNLLGGIGTVCAAFFTRDWPPMWALYDYRLLYQVLMIVTILIGIVNVWVTVQLILGGENVYRNAVIILVVGSVVAGTQLVASELLRGKGVPTNMKFYANLITLIYFLILKLPSLRDRVDFSEPRDTSAPTTAGGLAAIVAGVLLLTVHLWVGSSHIFEGENWVFVLDMPLSVGGLILFFGGLGLVFRSRIERTLTSILGTLRSPVTD
ncbi:MAG: hypothetical protein GTO18_06050 [Anaerolineales bacterium]|nr:hypothetical protein [Anaerolineales bacterium]